MILQNDGLGSQRPSTQYFEQHCEALVQGLPLLLQPVSGVHVPLVPHSPPQHWPSVVHAALSAVHCVAEHAPFTQANLQQSVFAEQASPAARHVPPTFVHTWVVASQTPLQHSGVAVQAIPAGVHVTPPPVPVAPVPVAPVPVAPVPVNPPVGPTPPRDASARPFPPVPNTPPPPPAPPPVVLVLLSEEHADAMPTATTKHTPKTVPSFIQSSGPVGPRFEPA
jgi:hypothetical protein